MNGAHEMSPVREAESEKRLRSVRALARLLDEAVRIPGLDVRVGLDAVLGLVPGVGDALGAALSGWVIVVAARLGAPPSILARMAANAALDALVGSIPLLGDLFDVGWRANTRNVALLERWLQRPREARAASAAVVVALLVVLALIVGGVLWIVARLLTLLVGAIT